MMPELIRSKAQSVIEVLRDSERAKYNEDYYASHYWREDLPGLSGNHGLTYDDPDHSRRFRFLYETVISPYKPKRMLDVGCGPGHLLSLALQAGVDAWGIDWSSTAKRLFTDRTEVEHWERFGVMSMVDLPFCDRTFDLAICMDALEHVPVFDIFSAVNEICRVSSGVVICSINLDNPYYFHPTILSRDSWIAIFENTGYVELDSLRTRLFSERVRYSYPEYDLFVFRRT